MLETVKEQPFEGNAFFVQIDELRHNLEPLPEIYQGKKIISFPEFPNEIMKKYCFPVYEMPKELVRQYIVARPNRYKLFNSEPIQVPVQNAKYAIEQKVFNPWKLTIVQGKMYVDKENGEEVIPVIPKWVEVKPDVKPVEASKKEEPVKQVEPFELQGSAGDEPVVNPSDESDKIDEADGEVTEMSQGMFLDEFKRLRTIASEKLGPDKVDEEISALRDELKQRSMFKKVQWPVVLERLSNLIED